MNRRGFILGALAAPAVVRALSIWIPPRRVILTCDADFPTLLEYAMQSEQLQWRSIYRKISAQNEILNGIPYVQL